VHAASGGRWRFHRCRHRIRPVEEEQGRRPGLSVPATRTAPKVSLVCRLCSATFEPADPVAGAPFFKTGHRGSPYFDNSRNPS